MWGQHAFGLFLRWAEDIGLSTLRERAQLENGQVMEIPMSKTHNSRPGANMLPRS